MLDSHWPDGGVGCRGGGKSLCSAPFRRDEGGGYFFDGGTFSESSKAWNGEVLIQTVLKQARFFYGFQSAGKDILTTRRIIIFDFQIKYV
jgi:hypothetical protein